jgi:hypothetical protein
VAIDAADGGGPSSGMSWTIGELEALGYEVTLFCGNHKCARNRRGSGVPSSVPLDLAAYPPWIRLEQIRPRLRCRVCGTFMGRTILSPASARGIGRPGLH